MTQGPSVDVDQRMLAQMRANSGHVSFAVRGEPADKVASALGAARKRIAGIRHPDEPGEQFASYISEVEVVEGGWTFWVGDG